jgi:hypothetical protein
MARRRSLTQTQLDRVLARARDLAEQVRQTAQRVQQEAKKAHRLTQIARRTAETSQKPSTTGRKEALAVGGSTVSTDDHVKSGARGSSGNEDA